MATKINVSGAEIVEAIRKDKIDMTRMSDKDKKSLNSFYKGQIYRTKYNKTPEAAAKRKAYNTKHNAETKSLLARVKALNPVKV